MLYAIRNGGFSGAIMPENIVVGDDAQEVAEIPRAVLGAEGAEGADRRTSRSPRSRTPGRRPRRARPQADPRGPRRRARGAGAARRRGGGRAGPCDRAGRAPARRCCPSWRGCGPSRTRRTRASSRAGDAAEREREIAAMRAVAARAKELERELARSKLELQAALAPLPNLPDPTRRAGSRGRAGARGRRDPAARLRAARPPRARRAS